MNNIALNSNVQMERWSVGTCMSMAICVQFYQKLYLRSILRLATSSFQKWHRQRNEKQNQGNQFSMRTKKHFHLCRSN